MCRSDTHVAVVGPTSRASQKTTVTLCLANVAPPSSPLAQHWVNIVSLYRVCCSVPWNAHDLHARSRGIIDGVFALLPHCIPLLLRYFYVVSTPGGRRAIPKLAQCWTDVPAIGPTLSQRQASVPYSRGVGISFAGAIDYVIPGDADVITDGHL